MFQWLRDLLGIYTWKELWVAVGLATALVGAWFLFSLLLSIHIVAIRAMSIWILVFVLISLAAIVDALRKKQGKRSS